MSSKTDVEEGQNRLILAMYNTDVDKNPFVCICICLAAYVYICNDPNNLGGWAIKTLAISMDLVDFGLFWARRSRAFSI